MCRLKKVLHGLKQSPQAWFQRLQAVMITNGYKQCQANHILFVKRIDRKVKALIVYMDDIVVTGNDKVEMAQLKSNLAREFKIKDLGFLKYFLEIEIARFRQ